MERQREGQIIVVVVVVVIVAPHEPHRIPFVYDVVERRHTFKTANLIP